MDILQKLLDLKKSYYHGNGSPLTDQEYDALEDLLRGKDPNNSFFSSVGYCCPSVWPQTSHSIPMGSLFKINETEEFIKWGMKFKDELLCLQYKFDGLSVSLDYVEGLFEKAITRGNGFSGEIISPNVIMMRGFKFKLPEKFTGSIRAEIVLYKSYFGQVNIASPDKYANPRNAAAGITRRLDGKFSQYLTLMCYDITDLLDEQEKIDKLKKWGFFVTPCYTGSAEELINRFRSLKEIRESIDYNIDGAVIKICSRIVQNKLGFVDNRPKGQIAWKFDPPGAVTTLLNVTWDVGRTGIITPRAWVEPVEIEGTIVKKSTLHNIAEISRLKIGIEDLVMLVKRGDIIPKITKVIEHKGHPIEIPTHCPCCQADLINDGIKLMCPNDACPRKNFNRILNWIKVTEIDTFGESLAEELSLAGKLNKIADIYKITKQNISGIEGWGDLSADTIIKNIDKTKKLKPTVFLTAIGIPKISGSTAEELLKAFGSIDSLMNKTVEDIIKLKGFSDVSANTVVSGMLKYKDEIHELLNIIILEAKEVSGKLSGMSFCFTGAMDQPRSFYQKLVEKNGGKNLSTVTKEMTYLVCNENKGSSKSLKAEQFGVKTISEKEFLDIVGVEIQKPEKVIESFSLF
jgi:DNA ligase (NAD+)